MNKWTPSGQIDEKIRELRAKQKTPETVSCFYLPKEKPAQSDPKTEPPGNDRPVDPRKS